MRIAIMGSGGVGAYVGSRLQAAGEDVVFIARGAHLVALQKDGLRLESPVHPLHLPTVNAVQEPSRVGPVDLIIFAVKLGDTEAAARSLAPMIGPETRILTLQNGIDSVDMITPHVGGAKVRGGVIYVSAVIDRPGVIRSPGGLHMIVADAAQGDPVMAELAQAAGCPFHILATEAPLAVLRERITERQARGADASEATLAVLEQQLGWLEPLGESERARCLPAGH